MKNGVVKLLNLRNVNVIECHKNKLAFVFNTPQHEGFLLFGSGGMNSNIYKEELKWETEQEAQDEYERLEKAVLAAAPCAAHNKTI